MALEQEQFLGQPDRLWTALALDGRAIVGKADGIADQEVRTLHLGWKQISPYAALLVEPTTAPAATAARSMAATAGVLDQRLV